MPSQTPLDRVKGSLDSYAAQYRTNTSRVSLREFQNLSGRPLLATFFWLAMRAGIKIFDKQIVDGPRPFAEDQCKVEELGDKVRGLLLTKADAAAKLGFHSCCYTLARSTAVHSTELEVQGGAIRMLHRSQELFLQILASAAGAHIQSYEIIVSATKDFETVLVTSSGQPGFNVAAGMIGHRMVGASIDKLLELHQRSIAETKSNLFTIGTVEEMGTVMDHMAHIFFKDKIERGIYVPIAS